MINKTRCTILLLLMTSALSAHAQENTPPVLEEVIVTAQKRVESLQDVPLSVTALTASDITNQKIRDANQITAQVPNLMSTTTVGDGFPIFSLRGISMNDFSFNQSSPVATYVDEVYKGNPAIQGVQIFDLERVEVLRGPQGTLYGKNTTGGAVNFITVKPDFSTEGYFTFGIGNYSRLESQGAFQTALVEDTLAMRLAYTWIEADGWFKNLQPGIQDGNAIGDLGIRASFLWQPTDDLEVLLRLYGGKVDAVNYGIQAFNISPDGVGAGLYGLYNLLGATDAVDYQRNGKSYWEFDSDQDDHRTIKNSAVSLTLNWNFSESLSLTSITSWDDGEIFNPEDTDGSPNAVLRVPYYGEATQFAQDLRIASDYDGAFNFISGIYYAAEEVYNQTTIGFYTDLDMNADGALDFYDCLDPFFTSLGLGPVTPSGIALEEILNSFGTSLAAFVPAGCQVQNDFDQDRTSWAGYFDGRYDLGDQWTLRFGLRYTNDKTELKNFSARIIGNDGTPLANTIPGDPENPYATVPNDSFTDGEWTGKIGADFTTAGGTLLYANYSHGYRAGAYNAQAFFDPSELTRVAPEKLDGVEIGFKSQFLNGQMQLNGAGFMYKYKNQQFLNVDPVTLAQTLINIDKSDIRGFELELVALPVSTLRLGAGLGMLNTEVKEGTLSGVNLAGNKLPLAPGINFNFAADWDFLQTPGGTYALNLTTTYVGGHYFEIFNLDRLKQDGYWVSTGRLYYTTSDDRWQIGLWATNLTNQEYRTSAINLLDSFGFDYSHIGSPRVYGADVTFRF
jgi:iron complex outermembrane recepter protein